MERIYIEPGTTKVTCPHVECDRVVKIDQYDMYLLSRGKMIITMCDCGKLFEVMLEKEVI